MHHTQISLLSLMRIQQRIRLLQFQMLQLCIILKKKKNVLVYVVGNLMVCGK
jgi:hypothetical protein